MRKGKIILSFSFSRSGTGESAIWVGEKLHEPNFQAMQNETAWLGQ